MKTKLFALAFLIGCGDKEQATATTATTEEVTNVENTTNTTAETTTNMVEVKKDITADNPVTTEENTTNVEGEKND